MMTHSLCTRQAGAQGLSPPRMGAVASGTPDNLLKLCPQGDGRMDMKIEPRAPCEDKVDPREEGNSLAMMISKMIRSLTVWKSNFRTMT